MPGAFSNEQAMTIVNFIQQDTSSPLLVHCTAGISRSGAVGLAIAESLGCVEDFLRENSDIVPNQLVLRKLRTAFNASEHASLVLDNMENGSNL